MSTATRSTSAVLRSRCGGLWESLLSHPFVEELAAGTLPLSRFALYLEQDILFLDDYARALGFAIGRAANEDELRALTSQLALVVERELEAERDLLRRVNELLARDASEVKPQPTTLAYSSFLLATAACGEALDVMAAQLPCAWSYADIGRRHIGHEADHPIYAYWVRTFGGDEYLDYVDRRLATFDRLASRAGPAGTERLGEVFTMATRLEMAFWDMAYEEGA